MNEQWVKMAFDNVMRGQEKLAEQLGDVQEKVHHLDKCLDLLKARVDDYREDQRDQFDDLRKTIKSIVPNGDFDEHRKDHELRMVKATHWQTWRTGLIYDLLKICVLFFSGWSARVLWDSFRAMLTAGGV